jgi:hypothetical protein
MMRDDAVAQRVREARRRAAKRSARTWWIAAALTLLLPVAAMAYFLHALADVTDPRRYPAIVADEGNPTPTRLDLPALASFPAAIPATATKVRFFLHPGFMQGSMQLQLRLALPAGEIAQILKTVQPLARQVRSGGDRFDADINHGGLPVAMFRNASNTGYQALPPDFQTFVLDARDSSSGPGPKDPSPPSWNHGYSYGVSISEKQSEVIYWLEDW